MTSPTPSSKEHPSERETEKQLSTPPSDNAQAENNAPSASTGPPADQDAQFVSGLKLVTIMIAITFPCFLLLLDISIIVTVMLQPMTGKFYMNFESKWTFLSFFALFELGSTLCGAAQSSKMLIVGRAVAGMGASGILNGAFTIIAGCVPMPKRPTLIGFVTGISQLGLVVGPLIGGALTQYATWRWCFYINLPIGGLVLALIAFVKVPEQVPKPRAMEVLRTFPAKLDLIGFTIFAPAAIMLLLALQYGGNEFAWNSSQVIGLFCGSGATFIVWTIYNKYKGDSAMIPFSMAKKQTVWSSCVAYGFFMGQIFCVSYYLPIYFQGVKNATPTLSGVYILPIVGTHVLFALASGWLVGKLGYYLPFIVSGAVLVAISNGLLSTFKPGTSTGRWVGYELIGGAGRGLGLQIPIIAVQNTLPFPQIPTAMALLMFSQAFGGALFLAFSELIFNNGLQSLIPKYAPGVNPVTVINAGGVGVRGLVSPSQLAGVLVAYSKSVDRVFYFTAGLAVVAFAASWFMGFKDVRRKAPPVSKA
ncbi:MAG: hypothetical protein Q9165_003482 [Trypethelium subeluteriae]